MGGLGIFGLQEEMSNVNSNAASAWCVGMKTIGEFAFSTHHGVVCYLGWKDVQGWRPLRSSGCCMRPELAWSLGLGFVPIGYSTNPGLAIRWHGPYDPSNIHPSGHISTGLNEAMTTLVFLVVWGWESSTRFIYSLFSDFLAF